MLQHDLFTGRSIQNEQRIAGQLFTCLSSGFCNPQDVDVFVKGYHLNASYFCDSKGVRTRALEELLLCGATIRLRRVQHHFSAWRHLCSEFRSIFGADVWLNAYFSQSGSPGLGRHQDPHHVFAVQCFGKKTWYFSENETNNPLDSIVAGSPQILFVPKGLWHQVHNHSLLSIHLTVGCTTDISLEDRASAFQFIEKSKKSMQQESFSEAMFGEASRIALSLNLSTAYEEAAFLEYSCVGEELGLDKGTFVTEKAFVAALHVLKLLKKERLPVSIIEDGLPRGLILQTLLGLVLAGFLTIVREDGRHIKVISTKD